jgi:hypothetical protein
MRRRKIDTMSDATKIRTADRKGARNPIRRVSLRRARASSTKSVACWTDEISRCKSAAKAQAIVRVRRLPGGSCALPRRIRLPATADAKTVRRVRRKIRSRNPAPPLSRRSAMLRCRSAGSRASPAVQSCRCDDRRTITCRTTTQPRHANAAHAGQPWSPNTRPRPPRRTPPHDADGGSGSSASRGTGPLHPRFSIRAGSLGSSIPVGRHRHHRLRRDCRSRGR